MVQARRIVEAEGKSLLLGHRADGDIIGNGGSIVHKCTDRIGIVAGCFWRRKMSRTILRMAGWVMAYVHATLRATACKPGRGARVEARAEREDIIPIEHPVGPALCVWFLRLVGEASAGSSSG